MTTPHTSNPLRPGLYITATPIGNLRDITYRAVDVMKCADIILCEDTRQTAKLCAAYSISTPRRPYHDHNGEKVRPEILERLKAGDTFCLVSDAGTPLISDPGFKLVQDAAAEGIDIFAVPGPSATIAALSISGLPTDQFAFLGFCPAKPAQREKFLKKAAERSETSIFFETSTRLTATLSMLAEQYPDRTTVVARELTKLHEEIVRGTAGTALAEFSNSPAKGEIVVLLEGKADASPTQADLDLFLQVALETMSVNDAAKAAAKELNVPKKTAYQQALALASEKPPTT
ncbi:MAG: 16S rRNA (cytidine(1402)-2'-O)-methyltransferase [Pseudomonadota bacterium]